jgi:PAS domain S-box-containing protein
MAASPLEDPTTSAGPVSLPAVVEAQSGPSARRAGLRWRIALAGSAGLVILIVVFGLTVVNAIRVRGSLDDLSNLHLAAESFRSINNTLLSMESSQRGFLLTGDSIDLAPFDTAMRALERRMDSMHRVQSAFPADSSRFELLDSLVGVRLSQMNATIAAFHAQGAAAATRQMNRNRATGSMDSIRATLRALNAGEEAERIKVRTVSARAGQTLVLAELLGGALALALLLVALRRIFADLDARESAEGSLRRSQQFLDSVIDLLPVMVFVKDAREMRFVRFNRTAEQLVGLPRSVVLGRTDADLFPAPMAEGFRTVDRAVLASDEVRDIPEEVLVASNGAVRTMHTRKVTIRDDEGHPAFLLGVSEDITARKRAEQDIQRARDTAEAANQTKSEFLAKMSHELRTPLNSIIGFSQLLEEESFGPLNDRQRRYVGNVLTSGRQLLELINDILDLSKVEAGRMELSLAAVALVPLLHEAIALVEPLAVQSRLHLSLEIEEPLPAVLVDASRLRQVLYNLLGNAIKFTGPGGRVTLRAAWTKTRSRAGARMIRITVQDTGVGIRPDDLERIFREFEQVDSDPTRNQQGTGLGLALSRRLVELHGGRIWAESEVGLGSSFHVELPVSPEAQVDRTGSRAARDRVAPEGPLVLVVEDDPHMAELTRDYLEAAGYRVAHAGDGDVVTQRVAELSPDAITLDVLLPGRDGLAVLRALKADPRSAAIPVLMMSIVDERVRGLALGAFDWLLKPVRREALVAAIQRAVTGAAARHPTVLAIDDDPGALDIITAIIEGAGFRAVTTTDARHGLELADLDPPAAIILDLVMPGLSGFELVAALRERPATCAVPIIVFSARDLDAAERTRLEQQVLQILSKPDTGELVAALRRLDPATAR